MLDEAITSRKAASHLPPCLSGRRHRLHGRTTHPHSSANQPVCCDCKRNCFCQQGCGAMLLLGSTQGHSRVLTSSTKLWWLPLLTWFCLVECSCDSYLKNHDSQTKAKRPCIMSSLTNNNISCGPQARTGDARHARCLVRCFLTFF